MSYQDEQMTQVLRGRVHALDAASTVLIEIIISSETLTRAELIGRMSSIADIIDGFTLQQGVLTENPVVKGFMDAVDGLIAEIEGS